MAGLQKPSVAPRSFKVLPGPIIIPPITPIVAPTPSQAVPRPTLCAPNMRYRVALPCSFVSHAARAFGTPPVCTASPPTLPSPPSLPPSLRRWSALTGTGKDGPSSARHTPNSPGTAVAGGVTGHHHSPAPLTRRRNLPLPPPIYLLFSRSRSPTHPRTHAPTHPHTHTPTHPHTHTPTH